MQCLEPIFIIFIYEKCAQVVFYIYTTAKNHMIILQANCDSFFHTLTRWTYFKNWSDLITRWIRDTNHAPAYLPFSCNVNENYANF